MSEEKKYNGWANYATWRIKLEIWDGYNFDEAETFEDVSDLAKFLDERTDEVLTNYGEKEDGLTLDYARAFVSDVDFYEIARSFIDDKPELIAERTDEEIEEDNRETEPHA